MRTVICCQMTSVILPPGMSQWGCGTSGLTGKESTCPDQSLSMGFLIYPTCWCYWAQLVLLVSPLFDPGEEWVSLGCLLLLDYWSGNTKLVSLVSIGWVVVSLVLGTPTSTPSLHLSEPSFDIFMLFPEFRVVLKRERNKSTSYSLNFQSDLLLVILID